MSSEGGENACTRVRVFPRLLLCECSCHCTFLPRFFFLFVCVCLCLCYSAHILYTLCAWCVTVHHMTDGKPPREDLERSGEQGTDVFQVEKRQQNLYKALSKAPQLSLCWSIIEWASVYSQSRSMKTLTNRQDLCLFGSLTVVVFDKYPLSLK